MLGLSQNLPCALWVNPKPNKYFVTLDLHYVDELNLELKSTLVSVGGRVLVVSLAFK